MPMERCKSVARRFPTLPGVSRTNGGGAQTRVQPAGWKPLSAPAGFLISTIYKETEVNYEP